jgi:hypothetical protein
MPADTTKVRFGLGKLYAAVVGSTEPTDLTTAFAVAWTELGYTEEGSSFVISPSYEDITVAEEMDPIGIEPAGRTMTVNFSLAQITAENLAVVMNGGTVTTGTGIKTFEPPTSDSAPVYTALAWRGNGTPAKEEFIWRKCLQTGDVEIARRRTAKALLPSAFRCLVPSSSIRAFRYRAADA